MTQLVIYTDLDGTLLEHFTYSFEKAQSVLNLIDKANIPLIFTSSKTRSEIEYWQKIIHNTHPFITENGGGIYIPKRYFRNTISYDKQTHKYYILEQGLNYNFLLKTLNNLKHQYKLRSFADMSITQLSMETGLPQNQAALAKKREYELPFIIEDNQEKDALLEEINKKNLSVLIGGRYFHLMGNQSKGKAIERLTKIFKQEFKSITTMGIGDGYNDISMLETVDLPYLVQRPDGSYISSKYNHAKGIGPEGWCDAIMAVLNKIT